VIREELAARGYAVVRGLWSPREVADVAAAFDDLLERARALPGPTEVDGSQFIVDVEPFRLKRVVWCGGCEPRLGRYGADPRFVDLAAEVLGGRPVAQIIQQAHFKLPGDGVDFDWHQDASNRRYGSPLWTDVNGDGSFVQMVVAVDPMGPGNGPLRMVPGSHRLGFVADPHSGALPPGCFDPADAVDLQLAPGDMALFGPFVIHGSGPNTGDVARRLFLQGYAAAGANRRIYPGCGLGVIRP